MNTKSSLLCLYNTSGHTRIIHGGCIAINIGILYYLHEQTVWYVDGCAGTSSSVVSPSCTEGVFARSSRTHVNPTTLALLLMLMLAVLCTAVDVGFKVGLVVVGVGGVEGVAGVLTVLVLCVTLIFMLFFMCGIAARLLFVLLSVVLLLTLLVVELLL